MATNVNLDALIGREDFEVETGNDDAASLAAVTVRDLETRSFFYPALRKPDFQRETSEWDPKRVAGLIRTFIEGDLIPAIILWKHRDLLFVIDGSHRLSALIAWVHDDYGDGDTSQKFFGHSVPQEQAAFAKRTRDLISKELGSYADHVAAAANPGDFGPDIVARARALASRVLNVQWVRGDHTKAEASFIRINQQAAMITPQELELLKGRRQPTVMAARAIIRRGTGHQHWASFERPVRDEIRKLAEEVHGLLFDPILNYPIKSLNLPAGGTVYSAPTLRMVYEFVGMSVGVESGDADETGQRTIEYLKRAKRLAELLISNAPASLGLHPAIYFYSWTGKQQPILLLTMAQVLLDLDRAKKLPDFIRRREIFERFLMDNRTLVNQIVRKFGTKDSGLKHLRGFYENVFRLIDDRVDKDALATELTKIDGYSYLQPSETPYEGVAPTRYSVQVKSGLVLRELLPNAPVCPICKGLVPMQAISIDHKERREDGGLATIENSQLTHPYCNTGIKEAARAKEKARGQRGGV